MTVLEQAMIDAAADPRSAAWDVVWHETIDQGDAVMGSEKLLPWLAATCAGFPVAEREKALVLAGLIAVDTVERDRERYAAEIAALRSLTVENLTAGASDERMFVYLQQAVLGFDGDDVWGRQLDLINDGETAVECPSCEAELLLSLDPADSEIEPDLPGPLAARLHAEAVAGGFPEVASTVGLLFGRGSCPECGAGFQVADRVAA
ncbi:hypothetical protein [Actinoplanes sp. CA-252034]|uniref:hypothetical protein n=1 Tax=Actinoplanes sp. CA-252034 TaxID=3239906 RepID=UPI003D97A611